MIPKNHIWKNAILLRKKQLMIIKAVYIEIQCKENKTFYFNIHTIKNNWLFDLLLSFSIPNYKKNQCVYKNNNKRETV